MISSYFLWNINEQYQKLRKTSCRYDCYHHCIFRYDSDKVLHLRAHGNIVHCYLFADLRAYGNFVHRYLFLQVYQLPL